MAEFRAFTASIAAFWTECVVLLFAQKGISRTFGTLSHFLIGRALKFSPLGGVVRGGNADSGKHSVKCNICNLVQTDSILQIKHGLDCHAAKSNVQRDQLVFRKTEDCSCIIGKVHNSGEHANVFPQEAQEKYSGRNRVYWEEQCQYTGKRYKWGKIPVMKGII